MAVSISSGLLSPKIIDQSWGAIWIKGADTPFKDAKLYPGGAREWDWNETGTRHVPGIQEEDVRELLENGAKSVVLSQGVYERLQIPADTRKFLEDQGIETHIAQTEKAVAIYNKLVDEGKAVGALLHSTC